MIYLLLMAQFIATVCLWLSNNELRESIKNMDMDHIHEMIDMEKQRNKWMKDFIECENDRDMYKSGLERARGIMKIKENNDD